MQKKKKKVKKKSGHLRQAGGISLAALTALSSAMRSEREDIGDPLGERAYCEKRFLSAQPQNTVRAWFWHPHFSYGPFKFFSILPVLARPVKTGKRKSWLPKWALPDGSAQT